MLVRIRFLFWDAIETIIEEWRESVRKNTRIKFVFNSFLLFLLFLFAVSFYYFIVGIGTTLILNHFNILNGMVLGDIPIIVSVDYKEVNIVFLLLIFFFTMELN